MQGEGDRPGAPAIGLIGGAGRMGRAIAAALADPDGAGASATLAGAVDRDDGTDAFAALARRADVLADFSAPAGLSSTLAAAVAAGTPLVIGTTGLEPSHHDAIDAAAARIAVLQTGNTSLGVTLLAQLVRRAAAALGPAYDIEIIEAHHRHKRDAPSGTALLLGEAAAAGRGRPLAALRLPVHDGVGDPRAPGGIGFASVRGGSIAGDHDVLFAGAGEVVRLAHHAADRAVFATGAIHAACWLVGRAPGRYAMADVLGLDG